MSLTPDQARAASAEASVAVVAGAGTGKTHTLGHRYLHHLRAGASPLEIVAVTFTERAAAELRSRVRAYLGEHLAERPDALVELEAAQISTLHALAARICRDHPAEADVPADFGVLEDLEGRVWLAEQLEAALASLPAATFEHLPYGRVEEALGALLADPVSAQEAFTHGPDTWPELIAGAREAALASLTGHPDVREAAAIVRACAGAEGDRAEAARRLAVRGLDLLDAGETRAGLAAIDGVDLRGGSRKAWPGGDLDRVKGALKTLRARVRDALADGLALLELGEADARLADALPPLRAAFDGVRAALRTAKRRARVLDFADLEAHALRALENPEVRAHYARRWRAVLVDEFQDTNPVQETLLERLTLGMTLTVVGDEKQGIYGFRGADVAVFRRTRERIAAGGGHAVVLRESFRAHRALVQTVNATFRPVLGELHQDLDAVRADPPHRAPHLRFLAVEAHGRTSKPARQRIEARAIAGAIRDMIDARLPVHDRRSGAQRPVTPGDVAVLTRSWSPLDVYGEVLPGLGVPAVHTGGGNLLDTRESKDGLALLRFLADPRDDLALAAMLRSPLFALDDLTLYRFARALPREEPPAWWDALETAMPPGFERPLDVLATLLRSRRDLPPSRLLQLADTLTGYTAVLANLPGATRREADWSGFVALVRDLERGLQDTFSVVRRLRRLLAARVDVPRPTLEAGDAVTLMTVHRSKGLEWPVVVVADLARRVGGPRANVQVDRELGVAVRLRDDAGEAVAPALLTLLGRRAAEREEAEARRVHYVALTRARDRLLLTSTDPDGGALDLLLPGLEAAGIPLEGVPFDPADATYPAPPVPEIGASPASDLWRRDPAGLGELAAHLTPKLPRPPPPAPEADDWLVAHEFVEALYPDLAPLAEALQGAGVRPPDPDGFETELTRGGAGTGHYAATTWHCGGVTLALADASLPEGDYDQIPMRVDPTDVDDATRRIVDALERC